MGDERHCPKRARGRRHLVAGRDGREALGLPERPCLKCGRRFPPESRFNRLCNWCTAANHRLGDVWRAGVPR
jgi:hypothetical protein